MSNSEYLSVVIITCLNALLVRILKLCGNISVEVAYSLPSAVSLTYGRAAIQGYNL